jgi:hypothetical protein
LRGVHLLFHSGRSQIAITYFNRLLRCWVRLIALSVPNPCTGKLVHIQYLFNFHGTFSEYCGLTDKMDSTALSFKWTEHSCS